MAHDRKGRFYRPASDLPEAATTAEGGQLSTPAVQTAGAKTPFDLEGAEVVRARLHVTAVGATPTTTVKLEVTIDGTNWVDAPPGAWPAKTTVSDDERAFNVNGWEQARWNVVGNTNVTFSVDRVRLLRS